MKAYFVSLFFLIFTTIGCDGNKKPDSKESNATISTKDSDPVDFAAKGMENLNASHSMKDIICQCWENKEDADNAEGLDALSGIEVVYRGYCLFNDGTMVKDPRGSMETGRWILNDKVKPVTLVFSLSNGNAKTYQLAYLAPYNMRLAYTEDNKKMIIDLGSEALRYVDPAKDPFHLANNSWRMKPNKPENDAQIKRRLKDCIHFFILFYEQKIDAHSDEVSFIGLPSCFRWYGGAIYLQKENELQEKWISSFYSREQAMKAYKLADKLISQKYTWPKKGNWLMQNLSVLKQMEARLDSL